MASVEELRMVRVQKVRTLENAGINPYPARVTRTHTIAEVINKYDALVQSGTLVSVVGRVMSLRGQGAIIFVDLFDGSGRFQALLKSDTPITYQSEQPITRAVSAFDLFKETVDTADFISITGTVFETNRGQKTIAVSAWAMVAKSLRPIPDEWYGLKDDDERYRRRYIDILLNEEVRNSVLRRSVFWNTIRQFLMKRGFVEVETPVLENTTGGADARPFVTHHNAFDMDVYLRISAGELWQKKLLVAGLPKVFEIGRIFRNEGVSNEHLQDYTQCEFYEAFSDFTQGMKMAKELYLEIARNTFGTTTFTIAGHTIELDSEWKIYDFVDIIKKKFDVDVLSCSLQDLVSILKEQGVKEEPGMNRERATDLVWKICRKELRDPGFLINVPVFLEPLAKKTASGKTVERFQILICGTELGKGFSELNNPIDQKERFEHQEGLRNAGDDEAHMKDTEYIEAMEYGMPPAFGFGVSERLFSVLNGTSIREAQIFPLMKPKE